MTGELQSALAASSVITYCRSWRIHEEGNMYVGGELFVLGVLYHQSSILGENVKILYIKKKSICGQRMA